MENQEMKHIAGLEEYIRSDVYRKAIELPEKMIETYEFLACGEYNINYWFLHPITNKKLVLRINIESQMHLEHQIEYEFHALELLKESGRTPKPFYVDGSKQNIPYGILVMEYLEGIYLDYETDLNLAAMTLADIHSIRIEGESSRLLEPEDPLKAILEECEEMIGVYYQSPLSCEKTKAYIKMLMTLGWERVRRAKLKTPYKCCINTELNSTNFLVNNGFAYLLDWEKPLLGDPAQDLGHFLAPTTTFWKTDILLSKKEIEEFLDVYIQKVDGKFDTTELRDRVNIFIPITCLRGITWCAMAWIEYQDSSKLIRNESTWKKLNQYLEMDFLRHIYELYLKTE